MWKEQLPEPSIKTPIAGDSDAYGSSFSSFHGATFNLLPQRRMPTQEQDKSTAPKKRKLIADEASGPIKKRQNTTVTTPDLLVAPKTKYRSSPNAVFGIPELLAAIMLELGIRDIFIVQRVCRQFRDAIFVSKPIQRLLQLRRCILRQSWDLCGDPVVLESGYVVRKNLKLVQSSPANKTAFKKSFTPAYLCTLARMYESGAEHSMHDRLLHDRKHDCASLRVTNLHRRKGLVRNMYITDPPCEKITFSGVLMQVTASPKKLFVRIDNMEVQIADGLTLGHLIDKICTYENAPLWNFDGKARVIAKRLSYDWHCETYKDDRPVTDRVSSLEMKIELHDRIIPNWYEWYHVRDKGVLHGKSKWDDDREGTWKRFKKAT